MLFIASKCHQNVHVINIHIFSNQQHRILFNLSHSNRNQIHFIFRNGNVRVWDDLLFGFLFLRIFQDCKDLVYGLVNYGDCYLMDRFDCVVIHHFLVYQLQIHFSCQLLGDMGRLDLLIVPLQGLHYRIVYSWVNLILDGAEYYEFLDSYRTLSHRKQGQYFLSHNFQKQVYQNKQ